MGRKIIFICDRCNRQELEQEKSIFDEYLNEYPSGWETVQMDTLLLLCPDCISQYRKIKKQQENEVEEFFRK